MIYLHKLKTNVLLKVDEFINDKLDYRHLYPKAIWAELLPFLASVNQWLDITNQAYGRLALFADDDVNSELFSWEIEAITTHFPPSPAKILIGGAGGGRELSALNHSGYQVAGFDPADDFVKSAQKSFRDSNILTIVKADYAGLISGIREIEKHAYFDAVILGWGSISHVGDFDTQVQLLEKTRELCPQGALLLSFIDAPSIGAERKKTREFATLLSKSFAHPKNVYDTHLGLIHLYDEQEIGNLARASGYKIRQYRKTPGTTFAVLLPG